MSPSSSKPTITQGHQNANSDHARIACPLILCPGVDECAEASMSAVVDEVDEVVSDGMEARRETLVLDDAFKLEARDSLFPNNGVTGLDIEVNQEEGRDGR